MNEYVLIAQYKRECSLQVGDRLAFGSSIVEIHKVTDTECTVGPPGSSDRWRWQRQKMGASKRDDCDGSTVWRREDKLTGAEKKRLETDRFLW